MKKELRIEKEKKKVVNGVKYIIKIEVEEK
jgi:hypothetical protein